MDSNPLLVAMLCDYLTTECDARLFARSHPRRRMDVDQGEFVTEFWLVRLGEAGRHRFLEHFNSRLDRARLFGTDAPCVLLARRVDIAPDGRETPWAWSIQSFGSPWQTIFTFDTAMRTLVSHHPWHTTMLQVWQELDELRARLKQVERELGEDAPRLRAELALEADLKQRGLWRKWQKRQMADDEANAVIAPHRAAYHAEMDALKTEKWQLVERITALLEGQELPLLEDEQM